MTKCPFNSAMTRKDFLNGLVYASGAAVALGGGRASAEGRAQGPDPSPLDYFEAQNISDHDSRYYPPSLNGMRGSHPGSFSVGHALRDKENWIWDKLEPLDESYDLVVVGGGISGLTAAYEFRKKVGPDARILILENHDDFGGHARRNEFEFPGRGLILGYGGTQNMEGVGSFSPAVMATLRELGIEPQRFYKHYDQTFREKNGLGGGVFFNSEYFGRNEIIRQFGADDFFGVPVDLAAYSQFLAAAPLAEQAKRDIIRLHSTTTDPLPGMSAEQKVLKLRNTSYADFLLNVMKVHPDVIKFYQERTHGGRGAGIDAVDAELGCMTLTPNLPKAMKIEIPSPMLDEPYIFHFPDGNASIARALVRSLIPGFATSKTAEELITERVNYTVLDGNNPVRLRLSSTVIRVRNDKINGGTTIAYNRHGKTYAIRSKACVLACWHMVIPYLCPEMPEIQRAAQSACVKAPLVYVSALVSNWQFLKNAGVSSVYCPGSYFSDVNMDYPVSMGSYNFASKPSDACVLHLVRSPCLPGLSYREQYRAGRAELYTTTLNMFELEVRKQLLEMYAPHGFKQEDLVGLTVNRWPHGYTYMPSPLWDGEVPPDQAINVLARKTFGKIAIANADAAGFAATQLAMDEAHRAVSELISQGI